MVGACSPASALEVAPPAPGAAPPAVSVTHPSAPSASPPHPAASVALSASPKAPEVPTTWAFVESSGGAAFPATLQVHAKRCDLAWASWPEAAEAPLGEAAGVVAELGGAAYKLEGFEACLRVLACVPTSSQKLVVRVEGDGASARKRAEELGVEPFPPLATVLSFEGDVATVALETMPWITLAKLVETPWVERATVLPASGSPSGAAPNCACEAP